MGASTAIKTTAGRGVGNIHGAAYVESFEVPFYEQVTVGGVSTIQLLSKIKANNQDKSEIYIIWDNA